MVETHYLTFPPKEEDIRKLKAGDIVYITGEVTSGAGLPTLERIRGLLDRGEKLPVDLAPWQPDPCAELFAPEGGRHV